MSFSRKSSNVTFFTTTIENGCRVPFNTNENEILPFILRVQDHKQFEKDIKDYGCKIGSIIPIKENEYLVTVSLKTSLLNNVLKNDNIISCKLSDPVYPGSNQEMRSTSPRR